MREPERIDLEKDDTSAPAVCVDKVVESEALDVEIDTEREVKKR
jgi:hypothetical protein